MNRLKISTRLALAFAAMLLQLLLILGRAQRVGPSLGNRAAASGGPSCVSWSQQG